uniref:At1G74640-like protein n=1 Tax=Tanacetum cinerariifolium TaxID=118510 RepID=A0A699JR19_TANCI|nr:At1G74640-like protein [Tanacetum cinerariifolium]
MIDGLNFREFVPFVSATRNKSHLMNFREFAAKVMLIDQIMNILATGKRKLDDRVAPTFDPQPIPQRRCKYKFGLLVPVKTREEFLKHFEGLEGKLPVLVVLTSGAPKRSKAEMEALREAKGVTKFVESSEPKLALYKFN